jgi:hypothetical protein
MLPNMLNAAGSCWPSAYDIKTRADFNPTLMTSKKCAGKITVMTSHHLMTANTYKNGTPVPVVKLHSIKWYAGVKNRAVYVLGTAWEWSSRATTHTHTHG